MSRIIRQVFADLYGLPSWNVRKRHGSSLTFEFGEPRLEVEEAIERETPFGFRCVKRPTAVHGAWHLWIHGSKWVMSQDGREIGRSESDDLTIERACWVLDGQALTTVKVKAGGGTAFRFDLGGLLETMPSPDGKLAATWMLLCPDDRVLYQRSDGRYQLELPDRTAPGSGGPSTTNVKRGTDGPDSHGTRHAQ
jgi:hypothetical protein